MVVMSQRMKILAVSHIRNNFLVHPDLMKGIVEGDTNMLHNPEAGTIEDAGTYLLAVLHEQWLTLCR